MSRFSKKIVVHSSGNQIFVAKNNRYSSIAQEYGFDGSRCHVAIYFSHFKKWNNDAIITDLELTEIKESLSKTYNKYIIEWK